MGTIAERVRQLVDQVHGGSVNAAAKAIGMKQQTLARIASGAIANPRGKTLEQIAKAHAVSMDWILAGHGPGLQRSRTPVGEAVAWMRNVDTLSLSEPVDFALSTIPLAIDDALHALLPGDWEDGSREAVAYQDPQVREAMRHAFLAWSALVEVLVRHYGASGARELFEKNVADVGLAFGRGPRTLLEAGTISEPDIANALRAHLAADEELGAELDRRAAAVPSAGGGNPSGRAPAKSTGRAAAKPKRKR